MKRRLTKVILIISIVVSIVNASIEDQESNEENDDKVNHVLDDVDASNLPRKIDKSTFLEAIAQPEVGSLIMFYAPWCGHCKRMVSTWTQLARKHNARGKFLIAKVDCADQTELCSDNDVLGYPTFLYFPKNLPNGHFYDGKRDVESIETFLYEHYVLDRNSEHAKTDHIKPVNELTDDNFDEFVSKGYHFVKFYAPWCGHCQKLAPTWEELGKKYISMPSNVKISKVDCTKNGRVCEKNEIRGYPTLLFFHNGKMIKQYDRQRTIEELSNFINELTVPRSDEGMKNTKISMDEIPGEVTELNDKTFAKYMERKGYTFVKFYAPWCSHCQAMAQTWKDLAVKFKDNEAVRIVEVDCTSSVEVCMNQNIEGYPTLVLFVNGNRVKIYMGDRSLTSLEEFLLGYIQRDEL